METLETESTSGQSLSAICKQSIENVRSDTVSEISGFPGTSFDQDGIDSEGIVTLPDEKAEANTDVTAETLQMEEIGTEHEESSNLVVVSEVYNEYTSDSKFREGY